MAPLRRTTHRLARRLSRALPAGVREVALALAARSVPGPALLPGPPPGPVLVVAPHPDDETIGAGGTLARHAARGDVITVVVASSGEDTTGGGRGVAATRESECVAACAALGLASPPCFLRLPDGALGRHTDELAEALRRHGNEAAVVYCPSVLDPHPDHRAANTALASARLPAMVHGYEVWSAGPVDVLVDVTATFGRKEAALRAYATALRSVDYVRTCGGLASYRSALGGLGGRGFAEGFVQLHPAEHRALTEQAASGA